MSDENKNENEDQDDFFGDDDDFGLPDLEYEALGDDDDSGSQDAPAEEEVTSEATPEPEPEPEPEPTPEPTPEPEEESMEDSIFGDESFDDDTMASAEPDVDAGTDDSTTDEASEFGDDMYSEEDFGDFDASDIDLDSELSDSVFDSDEFSGDEFKDFESEDTGAASDTDGKPEKMFNVDDNKGSKAKFARIVIFGTILFVGLGAVFFMVYSPEDEPKEVARKEAPKKAPAQRPAQQKPAESEAATPKEEQPRPANNRPAQNQRPAAQNNRPAAATAQPVAANPGTVNRLTERTGNAYVIIASFVDEDIAADYANKLASEGKSPSIIAPYGNGLFNRVAIAGFPTIAAAQQGIGTFKSEYGEDVWILKY